MSAPLAPLVSAQEPEGGDTNSQPFGQAQVGKLTLDEQLKLRAAQQKAAEDPAVKAAIAKRNQAIEEFRQAMNDSMVKEDPKMKAILEKIAVGGSPGF